MGEAKTMTEPKQVSDTSEPDMVGRKVRVALDGPKGRDGATIAINGCVTGQYVEEGDTEDTTIFVLSVSGPILGVQDITHEPLA
jgi:hypothetical protein